MRVTIERNTLFKAINTAGPAVKGRDEIPILTHFRLEAGEGAGLKVEATDTDRWITVDASAHVGEPGGACVPARHFSALVGGFPEGCQIELTAEDSRIELRSGSQRGNLPTLPAEDFPSALMPENPCMTIPLDAGTLAAMLAACAPSMGVDDPRVYLNGIAIDVPQAGLIRAVAVNGSTMNTYEAAGDIDALTVRTPIIPRAAVPIIQRALKAAEATGEMEAVVSESLFRMTAGAVTLVSKLVDGQYPNYMRLFPSGEPARVEVSSRELLSACQFVASVAEEKPLIAAEFEDGAMALSLWRGGADRQARKVIPVNIEGSPPDFAFNGKFMEALLDGLAGETLAMSIVAPNAPIRFDTTPPGRFGLISPVNKGVRASEAGSEAGDEAGVSEKQEEPA